MKQILVLGAGLSSTYLIDYLLKQSQSENWFVTVGDMSLKTAKKAVNGHANGAAIKFDVNDAGFRGTQIEKADIVVNMLPPSFQYLVAIDCVLHSRSMVSASYQNKRMKNLDAEANRKGVLLLTEMGLDPGIDHMIAMSLIHKIRRQKGKITSFKSYGGALPAPDSINNPFKYFVTWNPRNVAMAGENGAQFLENGQIKMVPFHNLFQYSWPIKVDGIGTMEVYPNRDTLIYQTHFDISEAKTIMRGTIRYPGWCETWLQIVRLGMANETLYIPNLAEMSYKDFTEMFVPLDVNGTDLEQRVASYLNINPTGHIMDNLKWFGLFADKRIGNVGQTASEVLIYLLNSKLKMQPQNRDIIILMTEVEAVFRQPTVRRESHTMALVEYGDQQYTAINKGVGLPVAAAVKLILQGKIVLTGSHIPTHPSIYETVLKELRAAGLKFKKKKKLLN